MTRDLKTKNHKKSLLIYFLIATFLVLEMGIQVSPSIMTTQLMHDLHVNAFGLGFISGVYFFAYAVMQIPSGLFFDRYDPGRVTSIAIIACSIGLLIFSVAHNIYLVVISRIFIGGGSAFAFIALLVVSHDLFEAKYFALLTGVAQLLAAMGAIIGQILVSELLQFFGWRELFFYLGIAALLLSALIWYFASYKRIVVRKYLGAGGIVKSLCNIVLMKQNWFIAGYAFLMWAPMVGFSSLWGVPYLIKVFGYSHMQAVYVCTLMWLGLGVLSPILGWYYMQVNNKQLFLTAISFVGFVVFGIILFLDHSPLWVIAICVFLAGGACSGQVLSFSLIREINEREQQATVIGFNNMAVVVSGFVIQPIIGGVLTISSSGIFNTNINYGDFKCSFGLILFCYLLATYLAFFIFTNLNKRFESEVIL
ncbi:MAG: MFS transporter [Gammaproteobacteria bacterium]|jgi:MFS family permease